MNCPFCGGPTRVVDSRPSDDGAAIRRRRRCERCGQRFTTYETIEQGPLWVVKKDGRRELFKREKLLGGLLLACEKRPVPPERLERLATEIETRLRARGEREVPSRAIGELAIEGLREIDAVAYVRFASVYRDFEDVERFREEVDRLLGRAPGPGR
ncbi:MAG: transcriptional regulator NrdR [Bacillota bacterium]|nr:transcriptional regulator NrdR [Bacillota bacterium]